MTVGNVPNEPAGRLREVLAVVRSVGGNRTLSRVWEDAAETLVPARGDAVSVRAEAGSLYHSVETSIAALPAEDDREAYRAYRHHWAKPIFGIGLIDSPNQHMAGESIVSIEALHTLSMLSSTLRHESPEPRPSLSDEEMRDGLDQVFDILGRLHMQLSTATWFDRRARGRLLHLVTEAIENVVFVEFRGYGSLERSTLVIEGELVGSEAQLKSISSPDKMHGQHLERVQAWLGDVRPVVRHVREMIEYDAVPFALGVSTGLATHDITAALGAWIGGRVALEGRHQAPPVDEKDRRRLTAAPNQEASNDRAGEADDADKAGGAA